MVRRLATRLARMAPSPPPRQVVAPGETVSELRDWWMAPTPYGRCHVARERLPAREIVRDAVTASKYVHLSKPVDLLLASTLLESHVATEITAKAYVYDVRFEKAFSTDVTDRVLRAFRAEGIHPPALRFARATNGPAGI